MEESKNEKKTEEKKTAIHQKSAKLKSRCFPLLGNLLSFVNAWNVPCHNPKARLV